MSFQPLRYLGAQGTLEGARAALVGIPYDGTTSYRPGTRFGPDAIRSASDSIETYDPNLDRDLEDTPYVDLGNVTLEERDPQQAVDCVHASLKELPKGLPLLGFGGEHTITLPLFKHALSQYPDMVHIVFDAHADLRNTYEDTPLSHACITRRIVDLIGADRVAMFGIRSGLREEFEFMRANGMLYTVDMAGMKAALDKVGGRPIYLSIDLDGFDPSEIPGTGTVEPAGFFYREFEPLIRMLLGRNVVGADVVELAPHLDPTGRSNVYAARVARALLILLLEKH